MFDIGWSELLIFAVVTLLLVGRDELPVMMRTLGRYAGMIRRQADEFRGHFDAAMQEAEFDQMQSEIESVVKDIDTSAESIDGTIENGSQRLTGARSREQKKTSGKEKTTDDTADETETPLHIAKGSKEAE